jgi:hypothetical protein
MPTDNFNAFSDNDPIESSASWTALIGALYAQNTAVDGGICGSGGTENGAFWDDDVFNADQYSQVVFDKMDTSSSYLGVHVRSSETDNCYGYYMNPSTRYFFKLVNGSETNFANSPASETTNAGYAAKIEVTGVDAGTITVYIDTGGGFGVDTSIGTNGVATDSDLDSGSAGIEGYGGDVDNRIDDWEGGDLGAGSIAPTSHIEGPLVGPMGGPI